MATLSKWSCRCLNVRIDSRQQASDAPGPSSTGFTWVFTSRDAVHVTHPQLTLRTRKFISAEGSRKSSRQTLLSCLVCRSRVYRIWSPAESKDDLNDGPVMGPVADPSDPLMSEDGWIEVSTEDCLDEVASAKAEHSFRWSNFFGVVLPHPSDSSTTGVSDVPPIIYPVLPQLFADAPLFLPPPFVPSDPVFTHLSACAQSVSDAARRQAQAELDAFTRRKFEESLELDRRLRSEVDTLWANWHNIWREEVEPSLSPQQRSSKSNGATSSTTGTGTITNKAPSRSHSETRRPEPPISIRDDFESIPMSPSTPVLEAGPSSPRSPIRSPPTNLASLLSDSRLSSPSTSETYIPSSRSRSPRIPIKQLSSESNSQSNSASPPPSGRTGVDDRSRSIARSSHPGRLLATASADESRAIAASYQIIMADSMAPARAAHLVNLGVPATFEEDEEEEVKDGGEDNLELPNLPPMPLAKVPLLPPTATTTIAPSAPPESPRTPKSAAGKRVSFLPPDEPTNEKSTQPDTPSTPSRKEPVPAIFELDDFEDGSPLSIDKGTSRGKENEPEYSRPRLSRQSSTGNNNHSERPGFIGSIPADPYLAKLAQGPVSLASNGPSTDWKEVTMLRLMEEDEKEAKEEAERMEVLRKEAEISPADTITPLPRFAQRKASPVGGVPASLPISIQSRPSNDVLAPKTSLIDRAGMKVPPLPRNASSNSSTSRPSSTTPGATSSTSASASTSSANRSRSKSISSVARDRTYAARDISHSKDPGEALTVPEEEEEEDSPREVAENGKVIEEKGRINAYRILARQTDAPDETMWRGVAKE